MKFMLITQNPPSGGIICILSSNLNESAQNYIIPVFHSLYPGGCIRTLRPTAATTRRFSPSIYVGTKLYSTLLLLLNPHFSYALLTGNMLYLSSSGT